MMSSLRWRLLLFLGECVFVGFGGYEMISGNPLWAKSIAAIFTCMGIIVGLAQLHFKLPLEFPRRKSTQGSNLFLLSPSPRKQQYETQGSARDAVSGWPTRQTGGTSLQVSQPHFSKIQLIPSASSNRSLQKQQTARRGQIIDRIFSGINIFMILSSILILGDVSEKP